MKLNHLDLQVRDVPALAQFLVDHFELRHLTRLDGPRLAILTDGHGFTLVIQRCQPGETYPADAHIGFLVDTPSEVRTRHARLVGAGAHVSDIDVNARGTSCYCRAPGGILIELGCRTTTRVDVTATVPSP